MLNDSQEKDLSLRISKSLFPNVNPSVAAAASIPSQFSHSSSDESERSTYRKRKPTLQEWKRTKLVSARKKNSKPKTKQVGLANLASMKKISLHVKHGGRQKLCEVF